MNTPAQQHDECAASRHTTAERWRRRAKAIIAAVERGEFDLLEHGEGTGFVVEIDESAEWGLTLDEVVNWPPCEEIAAMLNQLFAAGVSPDGWLLSRVERIEEGQVEQIWHAEFATSDTYPGARHRIEINSGGDVSSTPKAPAFGVLVRALREAVAKLSARQVITESLGRRHGDTERVGFVGPAT